GTYMTVPTIGALPTPPSILNAPAVFAQRADALLGALPSFRTDLNTLADYLEGRAVDAAASATAAAASRTAAQTAAQQATTNGAYQVSLAAQQVTLAAQQAQLATSNGAAQVALAASQVALAKGHADDAAEHAQNAEDSYQSTLIVAAAVGSEVGLPTLAGNA